MVEQNEPGRTRWYRLTYFLPIIVPVAVIITFFVFYWSFVVCSAEDASCSPLSQAAMIAGVSDTGEARTTIYVARATWTLVSGVHFLACLLAVIVAGMIIYHALPDVRPSARWTLILLVIFAAVDVSLLVSLLVTADSSSPAQQLLRATVAQALPSVNKLNRFFDALSLTATLCLACAACVTLWQHNVKEAPNVKDVARRMRLLRYALYVGAALLALSVLRLSATLGWGASFLAPDSETGRPVGALVTGITTTLGAYYTLLMAGVYIPATLLLRGRARELAVGADEEEKEEFLKKHGLAHSYAEYLPKVIALLGPLLAGPLGDLMIRAVSAVGD